MKPQINLFYKSNVWRFQCPILTHEIEYKQRTKTRYDRLDSILKKAVCKNCNCFLENHDLLFIQEIEKGLSGWMLDMVEMLAGIRRSLLIFPNRRWVKNIITSQSLKKSLSKIGKHSKDAYMNKELNRLYRLLLGHGVSIQTFDDSPNYCIDYHHFQYHESTTQFNELNFFEPEAFVNILMIIDHIYYWLYHFDWITKGTSKRVMPHPLNYFMRFDQHTIIQNDYQKRLDRFFKEKKISISSLVTFYDTCNRDCTTDNNPLLRLYILKFREIVRIFHPFIHLPAQKIRPLLVQYQDFVKYWPKKFYSDCIPNLQVLQFISRLQKPILIPEFNLPQAKYWIKLLKDCNKDIKVLSETLKSDYILFLISVPYEKQGISIQADTALKKFKGSQLLFIGQCRDRVKFDRRLTRFFDLQDFVALPNWTDESNACYLFRKRTSLCTSHFSPALFCIGCGERAKIVCSVCDEFTLCSKDECARMVQKRHYDLHILKFLSGKKKDLRKFQSLRLKESYV